MCRMTIGPRATQAKSPKPRRELGCTCGLFRKRGVRIAEKLGQAPSDSCVVSSGVFLTERGGQYSQQVVCPRRSAVAQKQPGSLEVVNMRDALKEVEADARMLPQGNLDVLMQLEDTLRRSNDVDVVQEGKNGFAIPEL